MLKLKLKPTMASMSYLQNLILVSANYVQEFTSKYNNHTMSFRKRTHENDSKLPKFICSLKDQNKEFGIKWSIFKKSSRSKLCNLCLLRKLVISNFREKERLLSKWIDLVWKCRHESKYVLINYWLTLKFIIV